MSMELFIGGPCDGYTMEVDTRLREWRVVIPEPIQIRSAFDEVTPNSASVLRTSTYVQRRLAHRLMYIHESMTPEDAADRLLNNYKPQR